MKRFDLVLFGATGFVGRQCAAYLSARLPADCTWAIAGRREQALADLAAGVPGPSRPRVLVADSAVPETITRMCTQTRVVLTTAGPFARLGPPVVAACVQAQTDYVDITGETPFVRAMIDAHHHEATANGVRIVPFCGYDSVPSDLGAQLAVATLRERGAEPGWVRGYHAARGGFNGGTLATALYMAQGNTQRMLAQPFLLNPSTPPLAEQQEGEDPTRPHFEPALARWAPPFLMGPINTRVVRRTQALLSAQGCGYGQAFRYQEYMDLGRGAHAKAWFATGMLGAMTFALRHKPTRALLRKLGPAPGEGPSEAARDSGWFQSTFVAHGSTGERAIVRVRGQGDPGNRATTMMVCESAMCLLLERPALEALPIQVSQAGVLTPGSAFGSVLRERLRAAGMMFEVLDSTIE